jgi:hypothetical protein
MDQTIVRVICVALVLVFGGLIFMRRRNRSEE